MDQLRRLGPADEVRTLGMPPIYPADITYLTRFVLPVFRCLRRAKRGEK
jgi:hypothetical protein